MPCSQVGAGAIAGGLRSPRGGASEVGSRGGNGGGSQVGELDAQQENHYNEIPAGGEQRDQWGNIVITKNIYINSTAADRNERRRVSDVMLGSA